MISGSIISSNDSDGIIQSRTNTPATHPIPLPPPPPPQRPPVPQWREAVAGAGAGAISRTIMAPIERIKLLQQLQYSPSSSTVSTTTGTRMINHDIHQFTALQIASKIYREEGWRSFWRGNVPNILRVAGTQALNFTCMDYYKRVAITPMMEHYCFHPSSIRNTATTSSTSQQQQQQQPRRRYSRILTSLVSGGLAGATATTILYPFEFVRTRLAMDRGKDVTTSPLPPPRQYPTSMVVQPQLSLQQYPPSSTMFATTTTMHHHQRQYTGMMDVVRHILLKSPDGILGFYQGYGVALVGGIIYRILYLGGYDAGKAELLYYRRHTATTSPNIATNTSTGTTNFEPIQPSSVIELTWTERFLMAQIIALGAGTMTYPFDSVRRRMMMQAGIPIVERRYRNSIHCTKQIWRKEGIRGFYLGLGPNLVRSVGGALILVGYDGIRTYL